MNAKPYAFQTSRSKRLLAQWFIDPLFPVKEAETRRRIQMLSGLLFAFGVLLVLAIFAKFIAGNIDPGFSSVTLFAGLILLIPVYLVGRTPWYNLAIRTTLALTSAIPFIAILLLDDFFAGEVTDLLPWLMIGFLLAVSLLSLRSTIILIASNLIVILALPIIFPPITYSMLVTSLVFLAAGTGLILANILYRDLLEQDRRNELVREKLVAENIINGLPGIFAMHDANGRLVRCNRRLEQILGYSFDELMPKKIVDFIASQDADQVMQAFQRVLSEGYASIEASLVQRNGTQVRHYLTALGQSFADQKYVLTFGIDTTALEQAKRAQAESEKNLRALLNAYTDTAFLIDTQGNFVALNETTARQFKRTAEELIGTSAFNLLSPALAESRKEKINQAIATGQPVRFVDQGKQGWNDNTIFPIAGADGRVVRLAIYARNITEYKIAEQKLSESEAKFRNIVESSPMGMHLYKLEADGRLVFIGANPAANTILGIDHQQFIGKTLEEAFPNLIDTEVPARYRLACTLGTPWYTEQIVYQDENIQGAFEVHAFQTAPGMMAALFMNVTERKRAEQETRQRLNELATVNAISQVAASQLELNALIELTGEKLRLIPNVHSLFIALCDWHTRIISFPYYRLYGSVVESASMPLGQGLTSWVIQNRNTLVIDHDYEQRSAEMGVIRERFEGKPDYRPKTWMGIPMQVGDQVIGILSVHNFEQEHAFSADDVRLWETIAANVGVAIQNAQLYAAAKLELVERQKLIAELESRNAELERFTYTVSHDLKSPLITIQGFLGFIEQDAQSKNLERLKEDLNRITNATKKMALLLNELLELSRIGRMMNAPEDVSFNEIVREAISLVHGRLDAKNIHISVADNLPIVHGDRARLVEVVQNLIDNAAKFTGSQTQPLVEIGMRGTDQDGKPIFFVRDNGMGIDPQFHERVFGLFNKLDAQAEGTGIGLTLVKRIVEVHGGRIWIESEGLGKGTTFCFTLA